MSRELMLIKVKCAARKRTEVLEIANVFRAKAIDISHESVILLITGTEEKVEAFKQLMEPFGILELTRTGKVAMLRESNNVNNNDAKRK